MTVVLFRMVLNGDLEFGHINTQTQTHTIHTYNLKSENLLKELRVCAKKHASSSDF